MFPFELNKCMISVAFGSCGVVVSAWLMGSLNSAEWGDDLPPHPSLSDGHGKPAPDRLGGQAGVEGINGVKGRTGKGFWSLQHGVWKNNGGRGWMA